MERCVVTYSVAATKEAALEENICCLEEKLGGTIPMVILYSSDCENFSWYSVQLAKKFSDTTIIGTSSYLVFSSKGHSHQALTMMALTSGVECSAGVILDTSRYPMRYAPQIETAVSKLNGTENCCCIEFTSAGGGNEDLVQDTLKSVLQKEGIPVFGGSAGSLEGIKHTLVSLNGTVYENACVFLLLHNLKGRIRLYCENMFQPTKHFFTATSVDCEERTVYEYDGKPAATALANALNISVEELPQNLLMHPMGRILADDIYITDTDTVYEDGRITYFTRIYNQTKMVMMEPDDIEQVWERTAEKVKQEVKKPSFCVIVNCLSRTKYFEQKGELSAFTKKLTDEYGIFIGISGFGEQLNFEHLNQTMVLAVFE